MNIYWVTQLSNTITNTQDYQLIKRKVSSQAPVAQATDQEAEIRRIVVQSQPGQIVHETLSRKHPSQKKDW
jgi:hypothetical protein